MAEFRMTVQSLALRSEVRWRVAASLWPSRVRTSMSPAAVVTPLRGYPSCHPVLRRSPAVIGGMPGLHGHERAATGCAHVVVRDQLGIDGCPILGRFDDPGPQVNGSVVRCRSAQLDGIFSRDRAGRTVEAG